MNAVSEAKAKTWLSDVEADSPSLEQKKVAAVIAEYPDRDAGFGGSSHYGDEELARLAGVDVNAVMPALNWLEKRGHIEIAVSQASTTGGILILNKLSREGRPISRAIPVDDEIPF